MEQIEAVVEYLPVVVEPRGLVPSDGVWLSGSVVIGDLAMPSMVMDQAERQLRVLFLATTVLLALLWWTLIGIGVAIVLHAK